MGEATSAIEESTLLAVAEKAKLRTTFRRMDIILFLVCTVVTLDTIGSVASHGAQGFTWLVFLGVAFFVPYAWLTSELGSTFPREGGPYEWTKLAFGRPTAAVNAVIYWASNPIWVGGTLTLLTLTAYGEFFSPLHGVARYVVALAFIWAVIGASVVSFGLGKWVPNVGGVLRGALLVFFTVSVVVYALKHGVHGISGGDFSPSYAVFVAVVPVLFFNYVGLELASAASEEMVAPRRDVPIAVARTVASVLLLYGGPILAILVVLPAHSVSGLSGFLDAVKSVFTVYGGSVHDTTVHLTGAGDVLGKIFAVGFVAALLSGGTSWIMGADRALATSALDGGGPPWLGRISTRFGTPVAANASSGVLATIVFLLAIHYAGDQPNRYFTAVLGLTISTTTVSYLVIFPALGRLRRSHPGVLRPSSVPGGALGATITGAVCTTWAALATVVLLWPGFGVGWFGTAGSPGDALTALGFGGQRLAYELTQLIPLVVLIGLGFVCYGMGRRTRRSTALVSALDGLPIEIGVDAT